MTEYVLEIVEGPEAGRQIPIGAPLEIGREIADGLSLRGDALVSRHHARVTATRDGVLVEDLDSRNGTFVDSEQIHGPTSLHPGQELLIGVTVLELRTRAEVAGGASGVRPIPAGLGVASGQRSPAPAAENHAPPPLARPSREPDYAPRAAIAGAEARPGEERLFPLLDVHTKRRAQTAPLALFVLVAIVAIVFLALR
jgi:pSer/pThr/pTyr-binding forkhead associated (FHA) protein